MALVALAAGELERTGRELAAHARRERELTVRREIDVARADAARDFHDVVAHTMTAVHVQLEAALTVFDTDPATAHAAVVDAKRSSRIAQHELRSSIAVLRGEEHTTRPPDLYDIRTSSTRCGQQDCESSSTRTSAS